VYVPPQHTQKDQLYINGDFGATKMRFGEGEERAARVSYVPLASPPLLPSGRALRRNAAELLEAEKRIFSS
jgi:hypothetical protein